MYHLADGIYFERRQTKIIIEVREGEEVLKSLEITPGEFASAVAACSVRGENADTFHEIEAALNRE